MALVTIDGITVDNVCIIDGITENFSLLEGISSQRTQSNKMWYDIVGTEISHTITIRRDDSLDLTEWENLWQTIRRPIDYHTIVITDGLKGTITYNAHISSGSRALDFVDASGNRHYGDYTITFTPQSPQITV